MKLYELSGAYERLRQMSDELDPTAFQDTLESIDDVFDSKVENIAKLIREFEAGAKTLKSEAEHFSNRAKTLENKAKNLREYLKHNMTVAGKRKVDTELLKIAIRQNPPSVNVTNEQAIPSEFLIPQPPKIDKKAISKALKDGEVVDGAELIRTETLMIT